MSSCGTINSHHFFLGKKYLLSKTIGMKIIDIIMNNRIHPNKKGKKATTTTKLSNKSLIIVSPEIEEYLIPAVTL
jgi:hypothetical protein